MQIELACICFGISAFIRTGGTGIGIGLATILYFLGLIANTAKVVSFLKYITPFGYSSGADIVSSGRLNAGMVAIGVAFGVIGILAAYLKYPGKDIH